MNEFEIYTRAFAVYLQQMADKPEEAARLAKIATKAAMAEWQKREAPKPEK